MKTNWLSIILIIISIAASACRVQPVQSSAESDSVTLSPAISVEQEAALLLWEGPALFAEDQTGCHRLRVTRDYQAFIGPCTGEQTEVQFVVNREGGLADMIGRFDSFQSDTPDGRIAFAGEGEITGPAWERAITSWAQLTYAELASGRVGAANHTALAWNLGEQDGQCQMLLVLTHGYATAGLTPCDGGNMEILASDWLDTAAWEQLDAWLHTNAPFYQDNSYLNGWGTTEMNAGEAAGLAEWVEKTYAELTRTSRIPVDSPVAAPAHTPPVNCLKPDTGQQLLLDEAHGYCLLYPAEYSLAQPVPESNEIVKGTVMNHIDPRVSIGVEPAHGRSLQDVAAQTEADYAPPGFSVDRSTLMIDGVEAVMFDTLPGQDLNRRVIFIQNERVYSLFFAPIGDEGSDTRQQAEALYQQVISSFRFL